MTKVQGKRQLQKESTKEHIIQTAMLLYSTQGFSVSTNIIAQSAGISHGSIFVHFPTRDELLLHTLNRFADELGEKLHNLALAGEDLEKLLRTHIDILKEYEAFYTHFISEFSTLPAEAKEIFHPIQSAAAYHFGEVIEKEVQAGTVKDIPIHMLFNTWIALLHYYLENKALFAPEGSVLERYEDDLVSTYLSLILI